MKSKKTPQNSPVSKFRVIGGKWRGRKLAFVPTKGLRPTPDRVRETLFNWLQGDVSGRYCLDLFAGSGALGFEALSRGAASCLFVDAEPVAVKHIKGHADLLEVPIETRCGSLPDALASVSGAFDLVFLDPPFDQPELVVSVIQKLQTASLLLPGALVYIEVAINTRLTEISAFGLEPYREKISGGLKSALFTYRPQG